MHEWFDDFKTAVAFLTRLPMPHPDGAMPQNFVRAHRMFPVVGALIGHWWDCSVLACDRSVSRIWPQLRWRWAQARFSPARCTKMA